MEERTTVLCQKFMENQEILKKTFRLESALIYPIAANMLTAKELVADEAKLKECRTIVSKNAGAFSFLKGLIATPFAVKLSMQDDPKAAFDKAERYYSVIKKQFGRSDFSALLAMQMPEFVDEDQLESVVNRGKELHSLMKKKHPLLTSESDSVFAGFLALSHKDNETLIDEMETCYGLLKKKFLDKDSVQAVSQVLSLTDGSADEKTRHFAELYDMLKAAGRKFDTSYLATLAAVSILSDDNRKLCDTILEIDAFLSKQKGYGFFSIDQNVRLMHAALLTTDLYGASQNSENTADAASLAMMAAQQVAMCIIIATVIIIASAAIAASID